MSMKDYLKSPLGFGSPKATYKKTPLDGSISSTLGSPSRFQLSDPNFSGTPTPMIPAFEAVDERQDYIILGEFSEQVGPVSIWTIPEEADLDQDELQKDLSRMMSVDYQMWKDAVATFKEDTRNVSSNLNTGVTYYAHHFTLLDIQARGYVRPLTLAYFTESSELIMSHYIELTKTFSGISNLLKRYNKAVMERDVARLIAEENLPETSSASTLLEALKKEVVSVDFPEAYLPKIESAMPQPLDVLKKKEYNVPLRDMTGLCGAPAVTIAKGLLISALEKFSQDTEALSIQENMAEEQKRQGFRPELELRVGRTMRLGFFSDLPKNSGVGDLTSLRIKVNNLVCPKECKCPGEYVDSPFILSRRKEFLEVATAKDIKQLENFNDDIDASKLPPLVLGGISLEVDNNNPWLRRDNGAGCIGLSKILHFPRKAPFARHIVFSLLKGRPVLVRGRKENRDQVERYVNLLTAFVPGYTQDAVNPWVDTPLKAAEMTKLRLVGVSTSVSVPYAIRRYSTVLNIDDPPSLSAPECLDECSYVTEILPQGKVWFDDESYLAHVQEVACKIAVRAFMYYHVCCVGNGDTSAFTQEIVPLKLEDDGFMDTSMFAKRIGDVLAKEYSGGKSSYCPKLMDVRERMQTKEKFKKAFGMSNQDFEIIENFAEIIKIQQYTEFGLPDQVPQTRLDFSPITIFDGLGSTKRQKPRK